MDVTTITSKLEGAFVKSCFSFEVQRSLEDVSVQLWDKVLRVYFQDSIDVLSPRACVLYPLLVREISTNATLRDRINQIWIGSWEGGCVYPAIDGSLIR